jgi:predicted ATPase/transcriptional regulator with XRE-family HTH domain
MTPHDSPSFGDLLRYQRLAAGLSQAALAELAGISEDAISLLERGERRRPQRHTVLALAGALALDGEELQRFVAAQRPQRGAEGDRALADVPDQVTPLLGRDADVERAGALLRGTTRLLTLTGPGGVGKSRLADAVVERLAEAFANGVRVVPLAPLSDPALVVPTIAAALGVQEVSDHSLRSSLEAALARREMLLVVDNFEHLLAAAIEMAALLAAAPRLRLLVTSRVALRVAGEREFPVQPLPVPPKGATADLATNPAVALFASRAESVQPAFALTPDVAQVVAEICRRVDGLPLAIELAAGRAKILPPVELLARLDRGLAVLGTGRRDAPARQQSLRATLGWSYDLLEPDERALFRRLAVFAGGWTVDAAETVCANTELNNEAVLDCLGALADHSLVAMREVTGGYHRLGMLETIREYAREQLEATEEADSLRRRHALHFLRLAEQAATKLRGPGAPDAYELLDREHDNLRAALRWASQCQDSTLGLRLAGALGRFWFVRGYYAEGRGWLERFLPGDGEHAVGNPAQVAIRARALEGLAALVYNMGDLSRASVLFSQSIALYRQCDDRESVARALTDLGGVVRDSGDRMRAIALLEESLALYRDLDDRPGVAHGLVNLGGAVYLDGDLPQAEALLAESVALRRELDDDAGLVYSLRMLGELLAERGLTERATTVVEESLELSRKVGDHGGTGAALNLLGHIMRERGTLDYAEVLLKEALHFGGGVVKVGLACALEGLAGVEAAQGRSRKAAWLFGGAAAFRGESDMQPQSFLARHLDADRAAIRAVLGEEAYSAEWSAGRNAVADHIIAFALGEDAGACLQS